MPLMLEILTAALGLTANPFALAGYIGLGVYATTTWRAFKYAVLWGLTIQIFVLALGRSDILDWQGLGIETALRLVGAIIVTMGIHYLYRAMRGGGAGLAGPAGGDDGGAAPKRKPPHLRQVK
jgi:hypothetical protein